MTHTYSVSGITCSNCIAKVQKLLSSVAGVEQVTINPGKNEAAVTMHHHVPTRALQQALKNYPKYQLSEIINTPAQQAEEILGQDAKTWFQTYKPVLLIFFYILAATILIQLTQGFNMMQWMNHFMAGFFLAFSFFKLLDVKAFAESYSSYDILAKKWPGYGYVYPFIELALGLAYLSGLAPGFTNLVTLVVMSMSVIGVLQSVLNKRKIKCACLGAVFTLPMSSITIIENVLMIVMSAVALLILTLNF